MKLNFLKIKYIILTFAVLALVSACSKISDTDLVKNGVMNFNLAITIGEAFDNWRDCSPNKQWQEFTTNSGQRVVEFSCTDKNAVAFMAKAKLVLEDESKYDYFDLSEVRYEVQWIINKDDSLQINYIGAIYKWKDGKKNETKGDTDIFLNTIYDSVTTYDLKTLQGTDAKKTARAYADFMYSVYLGAQ